MFMEYYYVYFRVCFVIWRALLEYLCFVIEEFYYEEFYPELRALN